MGERGPERKITAEHVQILSGIAKGMTNPQLAEMMGCSAYRISDQLKIVFKFLGAQTRTQAVVLAVEYGLLLPDGTVDPR